MKKILRKNQIMITALALMIAVAGYLNFAGTKIGEEDFISVDGSNSELTYEISDEDTMNADMYAISLREDTEGTIADYSQQAAATDANGDILSLDTDDAAITENYLTEGMDTNALAADTAATNNMTDSNLQANAEAAESHGVLAANSEENADANIIEQEVPGEAVFTSTTNVGALSSAKLLKEQTRARNKETLLEIINNVNISEEQKQEAVDNMIALTDIAEKETAAEILLESKGFDDVVVSITDYSVDVVVNASELSEAQRAQIEDIIIRKTGVSPDAIVISTMATE